MNYLTHLECTRCGRVHEADVVQNLCRDCGKPLYARYDLEAVGRALRKGDLLGREATLWRYRELLPVREEENVVSLGEGFTPLLRTARLGRELGLSQLWVKDEAPIPTGTFKARGMTVAVSRAKELGVRRGAVPTAGNAGGALAAYGARAGMEVYIFMPQDTPEINRKESVIARAHVYLVNGLITDCGRVVREGQATMEWFDFSTLKEPYRVEGKKTLGLELAEQFRWELPDTILYPTGGGTGLVGMWKAFDELEQLGWIDSRRPRLVAVQATGCAPIVKAFEEGRDEAEPFPNAQTFASGLRVPAAIGDFLMLDVLRASGGTAVSVPDEEIREAMGLIARTEGIIACPEGAATVAGARRLRETGFLNPDDRVVLFNTGSGLKYPESIHLDLPLIEPDVFSTVGRLPEGGGGKGDLREGRG